MKEERTAIMTNGTYS